MNKFDIKRVTVTITFDLISDLDESQVKKSMTDFVNKINSETSEVFGNEKAESLGLSKEIKVSARESF